MKQGYLHTIHLHIRTYRANILIPDKFGTPARHNKGEHIILLLAEEQNVFIYQDN